MRNHVDQHSIKAKCQEKPGFGRAQRGNYWADPHRAEGHRDRRADVGRLAATDSLRLRGREGKLGDIVRIRRFISHGQGYAPQIHIRRLTR